MQCGRILWLLLPFLGALLISAPVIAEPSSGLVPPDGFIFGGNGHPGSGVYSQTGVTITEQMGLLNDVGLGWYRFDVLAREPADELDFIVPAAEQAGIELYPMLYPPVELRAPCPPDPKDPCDPDYPHVLGRTNPATCNENGECENWTLESIEAASFEHAKNAASKWQGRIKVWDLLNEPDGWTILSKDHNGLDPKHYCPQRIAIAAAILRGQANGIKAGDPQAKVSLNTGGSLHTGFVDLMKDNHVQFDILSWHWYNTMGRIDRVAGTGNLDLLEKLRSFGKPIWIGEANARMEVGATPTPPRAECSRDLNGLPDPSGEAWALEFMRSMHGYRSRGVEAYFHYQILDQPGAEGHEANYGLVEIVPSQINGKDWAIGTYKPIYCKTKQLIAGAKEIKSDGSFFTDFFDGSALDPTKWSTSLTGAWNLGLSGGQLHWDSGAAAEGYFYTKQAFAYNGAAEWALEIRFKVNPNSDLLSLGPPTGNSSTSPRQVQLIAGSTNPANPGITKDFSLSLLEHPSNSELFSLGWSNWLGVTDASLADPNGFATDLARGVFYTVVLHHRADGEINIYIDGIHLATRTSFAGTALSLVMADLSSGIGADVDLDYIRFGLPLIRDSVASP